MRNMKGARQGNQPWHSQHVTLKQSTKRKQQYTAHNIKQAHLLGVAFLHFVRDLI